MRLKEVFRFPETLLLLSILPGLVIVWQKTIDIQIHDTYFVFGGSSWGYVFFAVIHSWVLHTILRQRHLISSRWRWIQVSTTVICWLAILTMLVVPSGNWIFLEGLYLYSHLGWVDSVVGIVARLAAVILFILSQLIFWIMATIRLISGRGERASE